MYDYLTIAIFIGVALYPFLLTRLISKKITNNTTNIKELFKNVGVVILLLIGTILISTPILEMYNEITPDSSSISCSNSGGWTYSCTGNDIKALIYFIVLATIFIIHSIIATKYIYKIFNNSKKIFPYIFMYLYMLSIHACQIMLIINLYGLFTTIKYSTLISILRLIVVLIPSLFYLISIRIVKNKQ